MIRRRAEGTGEIPTRPTDETSPFSSIGLVEERGEPFLSIQPCCCREAYLSDLGEGRLGFTIDPWLPN
jgi:hypothetical protein